MTHSPTPDDGLDVSPDDVEGLRKLARITDTATPQSIVIQATTAALGANPMLDYKDVKRYFTAVLAQVQADAVAEHKARFANRQTQWTTDQGKSLYRHAYLTPWMEVTASLHDHGEFDDEWEGKP